MGIAFGTTNKMLAASVWAAKFDDFLSASIGEEKNGRLSVISMFGRLNIDPWQEAFQLANLTKSDATHRLAQLIAQLPEPVAQPDPQTIAARLVARLPKWTTAPDVSADAPKKTAASRYLVILAAGLIALTGLLYLFTDQSSPLNSEPQTTTSPK